MSIHYGDGVSRSIMVTSESYFKHYLFLGDNDMDAEERKDVKILHPTFGA